MTVSEWFKQNPGTLNRRLKVKASDGRERIICLEDTTFDWFRSSEMFQWEVIEEVHAGSLAKTI